MEVNTKCCNKEMENLGDVDLLNNSLNFCHRFICLECGRILDIIDYSLDDEQLINEIEVYFDEDKRKKSKIYNELIKERELYKAELEGNVYTHGGEFENV